MGVAGDVGGVGDDDISWQINKCLLLSVLVCIPFMSLGLR